MPNNIIFLIFIIHFVSKILYQIEAHPALEDMPAPKGHPCYTDKEKVCFSGHPKRRAANRRKASRFANLIKFCI